MAAMVDRDVIILAKNRHEPHRHRLLSGTQMDESRRLAGDVISPYRFLESPDPDQHAVQIHQSRRIEACISHHF
jgi:hypothetical protein